MRQHVIRTSIEAGAYITLLGLVAWLTGRPFIFPSLGPTALALTLYPAANSAREVLVGHLCGVVCGLFAYHVFAAGLLITAVHTPLSADGLWLAVSGALSVSLTMATMMVTRAVHAPACATTLIVSLGLLPTILDGVTIMTAVIVLYGAFRLQRRFNGNDASSSD